MRKGRTVWEVNWDVDKFLQDRDSPHAVLVGFYKRLCAFFAIDWDDVEVIEPVNIRLSEKDWTAMCNYVTSFATDRHGEADLGLMFVNKGPGSDYDVPAGTIRLLDGWVEKVVRCTCGECEANDHYFTCASRGRRVPWCFGAADRYPDLCDDCAVKEAT